MLFNSYIFILFFLPVVLTAYFMLNRFGRFLAAKGVLIIASLFFYGYSEPSYVPIILLSIGANYLICMLIRKLQDRAKALVVLGIVLNLGLLGYFKYFDFLLENINNLTKSSFDYLQLALPLGISFFTFQQISYLIDTAKGECKHEGFLDYVLFVTFFPQLVAGPIVSHDEILPQFASEENKKLDYSNLAIGIRAFSIGLFKKVIIADNFGKIVSFGYGNIPTLNSLEAVLTILAYTIQIYFDFSGYCDMATGIGLMFNIKLPANFNSPYKATTIVEFWKRWHITLTRFLTKYVYIPLGGNRKGKVRTYINILIVFFASGLWHGAGYTHWINWIITFVFINLTWVVFRAESVDQAWKLICRITAGGFGIHAELAETMLQPTLINIPAQIIPLLWVVLGYTVLVLAVALFAKNTNKIIENQKQTGWTLASTYVLFLLSVLSLSGVSTFLYFNF